MPEEHISKGHSNTGIWLVSFVCMALVIIALSSGAAYSGISVANEQTAQAHLNYIESTFLLAEATAMADDMEMPPSEEALQIYSYDHPNNTALSEYTRFIRSEMIDHFGANRNFDFSVHRYEDSDGMHLEVSYFPVRDLSNPELYPYYSSIDGVFVKN